MQSEIMPVYRDHECPADDALRDSLGCVRPRRAALQPASPRRRWAIARRTSSNDPRSLCTEGGLCPELEETVTAGASGFT